jgi:RNA polymerase sigma factor for flagellar operon FliA
MRIRKVFVSKTVPRLRYTRASPEAPGPTGAKNEMRAHHLSAAQNRRVVAGIPFVEALARRMASTMPHSIDVGDLVQDGVIGLIDAAHRFDDARGIKFETFAERRIRGAMIDALRRDAWPRGVRRQRRELEAARETLRRELGHEPSLSDLAAKVGTDEKRLGRTIVRIATIESTSPLATSETVDEACLPTALVPSEPEAPDAAYERTEVKERVRAAIASLPPRERKVIGLYYYGDVTMKQIGAEIGVNESRVSQLHARAIKRLRLVLGEMAPAEAMSALKSAVLAFHQKPVMAKAQIEQAPVRRDAGVAHGIPNHAVAAAAALKPAVVVAYKRQPAGVKTARRPFVASRNTSRVAVAAAR